MNACPRCDEPPALTLRGHDAIAEELAMRDAFFSRRLNRELRDVTDALLGVPSDVLQCATCGILVRDCAPDDDAFRDDRYHDADLESLHAVHAAAFRAKELDYRPLLSRAARVLEVGSYAGGFLAAAAQWGWSAIGVDIGHDTSRFAQSLGFDVRTRHLEECELDTDSFDAVFIWNCFEQLASPRAALAEARRILKRAGVLVLRVPDADFYLRCTSVDALADNGLLGWPHRFGFGAAALRALANEHHFALQRVMRTTAIRPPWPHVEDRQSCLSEDAGQAGLPVLHRREPHARGWIELTFRKGRTP